MKEICSFWDSCSWGPLVCFLHSTSRPGPELAMEGNSLVLKSFMAAPHAAGSHFKLPGQRWMNILWVKMFLTSKPLEAPVNDQEGVHGEGSESTRSVTVMIVNMKSNIDVIGCVCAAYWLKGEMTFCRVFPVFRFCYCLCVPRAAPWGEEGALGGSVDIWGGICPSLHWQAPGVVDISIFVSHL